MRTTARILVGWAAVVICQTGNVGFAGPPCGANAVLIAAASTSQADASGLRSEDQRREAADLLHRARQAMAENDLDAAEKLVAQAEALGIQYGRFHLGDTPQKVRKDLNHKQQTSGGSPARPSQLFTPKIFKAKQSAPQVDPFAGHRTDSVAAEITDKKGLAVSHLLKARNELAQNNLPGASHWYRMALKQGATFTLDEDSPAKLAADIKRRGGNVDDAPAELSSLDPYQITPLPSVESYNPVRSAGNPLPGMSPFARPVAPPSGLEESRLPAALEPAGYAVASSDVTEPTTRAASSMAAPSMAARQKVAELTRQARSALNAGQLNQAESLAQQANQFQVPDHHFDQDEDCPRSVLLDVRNARMGNVAASNPMVTGGPFGATASRAVYDSADDRTQTRLATAEQRIAHSTPSQIEFAQGGPFRGPVPPPAPVMADQPAAQPIMSGDGLSLFQQGEEALKAHDTGRAYGLFQRAAGQMDQLDPVTARRLQGYLQLLSVPGRTVPQGQPARSVGDEMLGRQSALSAQLLADVANDEAKAKAQRESDPKAALAILEGARTKIENAPLDPAARQRLLARVDRALSDTRQFIEQRRPLIELQEKNERTREEIEREQRLKLDNQEKIALMVDEFQKLIDEERYAEAEVVAKRARELAPNEPVVMNLNWLSKILRRKAANDALRAEKEDGFVRTLMRVDESSLPFDDGRPYRFPDVRDWEELSGVRARWLEQGRQRSAREIEIEQKLKTPVSLEFSNEPLANVLKYLADLAGVNMVLDPQGLAEEGVATDVPVTIEVRREIMLKSALNLILEPLHLSYVVKDEVLKVTSEQLRDGEVHTVSYNVADLVIPIPNFVPNQRMGLSGALHDALGQVGFGGAGPMGGFAPSPMAVMANNNGSMNSGAINPAVLAQVSGQGGQRNMPMGFGPGGLGGGSQADFDSLIELITSTIQPTTWDEVGGPGSIAGFETNLSLVVSQTQDVHEEIVDLLEQLRRLQDLQVTIEVRFITLNDNFFERIGVDFDFEIDDDIDRPFQVFGRSLDDGDPTQGLEPSRNTLDVDDDRSVKVGMQAPGVFSADLDIPFSQNSFALAVPQFGGFDASAGASLGFAILSDLEAFFFINAAQGDRRSNVLQAPKVTLFNGQMAYVSDTSQSPFVISVIPVVGDFAAAQQPVIVVLTEGTFMTVQAVVSHDRRFVRLTVVPFFSKIEDVDTFQFEGEQTSTTNNSADNEGWINLGDATDPDWQRVNDGTDSDTTTTSRGTTVQLPTFSFVTVTTTVSVPDGGTVLLGGIKRLSEGRNEFGVPILNKVPYLNRLFKNVGIGRETQSLMMMVTPRIIIQEEEEEKLGISSP